MSFTAAQAYAVFDTPIGCCAVAWSAAGLTSVWLPECDEAALRARLASRLGDARESEPPPPIREAIARITALLEGGRDDLADVPLDLDGVPDFHRRVYEAARRIVPGRTLTYGEMAQQLGEPGAARAIGQALGRNPWPIVVPCHRVLAAGGRAGGFSAPGGLRTKLRLLEIEQARLGGTPGLFDRDTAAG
jgi:methylated-DNA-[protein]-cysteine S-methyltransferase